MIKAQKFDFEEKIHFLERFRGVFCQIRGSRNLKCREITVLNRSLELDYFIFINDFKNKNKNSIQFNLYRVNYHFKPMKSLQKSEH